MSPRRDVSQERRNQILDAAMEIFSKVGFYKARMSDIAESSGLSKGSLYWYFESKNDLILQLLARVFEPELQDMRLLLDDPRPTPERLLLVAERAANDMESMLKWTPLAYDFIALAFRQRKIMASIRNYYQQHITIMESLVQQGLDAGELEAESASSAAIAFGSVIEGTVLLWVYDPKQINVKQHVMSNVNYLLNGLMVQQPGGD